MAGTAACPLPLIGSLRRSHFTDAHRHQAPATPEAYPSGDARSGQGICVKQERRGHLLGVRCAGRLPSLQPAYHDRLKYEPRLRPGPRRGSCRH